MLAAALFLTLPHAVLSSGASDLENPPPTAPEPEELQPNSASSSNATPAPPRRNTAIYVTVGAGTPVGIVGLEAVRRLGEHFEMSAGFGEGVEGLQWAAMPRLRLGNDTNAFAAGVGLSGGKYGDIFSCIDADPPCSIPLSYFLWTNYEIAGEHWSSSGFAFRGFMGFAQGWCVSSLCPTRRTIPYFGIGLGYAF
jgi:hypothetical protein